MRKCKDWQTPLGKWFLDSGVGPSAFSRELSALLGYRIHQSSVSRWARNVVPDRRYRLAIRDFTGGIVDEEAWRQWAGTEENIKRLKITPRGARFDAGISV